MDWTEEQKKLRRRILAISYKYGLSHIGSCLTAVDIINDIYKVKKKNEKFVLSSGHAGLALYVVLEHHGLGDAEKLFKLMGVHPDRLVNEAPYDWDNPIDCSTGSLGEGLPIAVGMALSDRSKNVYCLISDGECAEGSIWEALRIFKEQKLRNLRIYLNFNGWGAYRQIKYIHGLGEFTALDDLLTINPVDTTGELENFTFLKGQDAHYYVLKEEHYMQAIELLK